MRENRCCLSGFPDAPKTTNSQHNLSAFHNLVKGMEFVCPNQIRPADITYIRIDERFLYLSLIRDVRSGKTASYQAGDTFEAEGSVRVLEMALKELPKGTLPYAIRIGAASTVRIGLLKSRESVAAR
jgi:hypothetical protein